MSDQNSSIDERLGSYLDGAVTDQQRAAIETLLRDDPSVANRLAQLRQMGQQLRRLDQRQSRRLPSDFADRVIEASIERIGREGDKQDHPLRRAATQPAAVGRSPVATWAAGIGVVAAVAASLLFAIAWTPSVPPGSTQLAATAEESLPTENTSTVDPDASPSVLPSEPTLFADNAVESASDSGRDAVPEPLETPQLSGRGGDSMQTRPEIVAVERPSQETQEPAAAAPTAADSTLDSLASQSARDGRRPRSAGVLVLNIELTDPARGMAPIRAAMREATIRSDAEQPLDQKIASAVALAVEDESASGSLMYLKAPAKQLDRFILFLLDDRERVRSVRFGLATEAPVLKIADQFADIDPTDVRHDFGAILGDGDAAEFGQRLLDRPFAPMPRGEQAANGLAAALTPQAPAPGDGPDVMADVFLLIR